MTRTLFRPAVLGLLALAAIVSPAPAQAVAQDTPATRQLQRWLDTFNANNRGVRLAFLTEHFPSRANAIDQEMGFRHMTDGFTLIRVTEATPTRAVALVQERDNDASLVRLTVEVEAASPHRITDVAFQAGLPLERPIARMSEPEMVRALKAEGDRRAAAGRFSGTVMVARNGKEVTSGVWGDADRDRGVRNTMETRFRNGSMNKMFTATAIMTLVQAGKVRLDAPLGTYLPDYPNRNVATKVTIHHLLTHTGGTGDIFGPQFTANRLQLRTHDDYLKLYGARELGHEPGARFQYSNYGFVLLGLVIERVSGQSYYDYVRDHVFRPAGMTRTASDPEDAVVADRSMGYLRSPTGTLQPNTETLPYRGTAAGGGYTTAGDLIRFATALMEHRLLDARHTELMLTGKVDAFGGRYAYGFSDRTINGLRVVGHGGGAPGMNGDLLIFPQTGYAVAALANLDPPAAGRMAMFAANRLPGGGATP